MFIPRDYQAESITAVFDYFYKGGKGNPLVVAPTGAGKCHRIDTPILMFDGSIKMVQHIKIDDLLMGPDSKPRTVLSLASGKETMYRIKPTKGASYAVNKNHILSLRLTGNKSKCSGYLPGEIANISVKDYLNETKTFRHNTMGWRTGVNFNNEYNHIIPPYILGLWLGDGNHSYNINSISNIDHEILREWGHYANSIGLKTRFVKQDRTDCPHIYITDGVKKTTNPFTNNLRNLGYGKHNPLHIPFEYKTASKNDRIEILSGIIDTDGYLTKGCYDLVFKDKLFADDICFVARSLGLAAYVKPSFKKCQGWTEKKLYHRISISGDLDILNCRVKRRIAEPRKQKKNVLNVGIKVEKLEIEKYYGFNLDSDGLYLLGDFTVTHNSIIIADLCKQVVERWPSQKVLVISHSKEILKQNYEKLVEQIPSKKIGLWSSGLKSKTTGVVTVAGIQSIFKKAEIFDNFNIILVDECFISGTKISTPKGLKNIEEIKIGDSVYNATGTGIVENTFKKKTKDTLILTLTSGEKIECTKNHKFFTENGWVKAKNLEGKILFRKENLSDLQKEVWSKNFLFWNTKRKYVQKTNLLLSILCKEIKKSNGQFEINRKNDRNFKKNRSQTKNKRWKWNRGIRNRKFSFFFLWKRLVSRIYSCNKNETFKNRLSNLLQNRYCKSRIKNCNRVGWSNPLWKKKRERQKENSFSGIVRVESISYKKQKSPTIVYDLQISRHPSYYANECLVHNCHSIPHNKKGRYHKFFETIEKPVIGFTATPFRLGAGYLHLGDNAFFDEIVYTIHIKTLQDKGHLCQVLCKGTETTLDATGIKKQAGDFILRELSLAFDREKITEDIIKELLRYKEKRKKWLLFAIDIEHCENINRELNKNNIKSAVVHSKMKTPRDAIIEKYKNGDYQALVSVAVLTTGFDVPDIDLIGLMRPTTSPTLHVQIIGRGLRPSPKKENCLVLDFAGNLKRNGPIDNPVIKVKGQGTGDAIMKECDNCMEIVAAATRICPCCGYEFVFKHNLSATPQDGDVLAEDQWFEIEEVSYSVYNGSKGIDMLKVQYQCGFKAFSEYVCFEHTGYPRYMAENWISQRSKMACPDFSIQAVEMSDLIKKPSRIKVYEGGKYPKIKDFIF